MSSLTSSIPSAGITSQEMVAPNMGEHPPCQERHSQSHLVKVKNNCSQDASVRETCEREHAPIMGVAVSIVIDQQTQSCGDGNRLPKNQRQR